MDRLNALGCEALADMPASLGPERTLPTPTRPSLRPTTYLYAGLAGFCCCSAAVIVTAGLLALRIQ